MTVLVPGLDHAGGVVAVPHPGEPLAVCRIVDRVLNLDVLGVQDLDVAAGLVHHRGARRGLIGSVRLSRDGGREAVDCAGCVGIADGRGRCVRVGVGCETDQGEDESENRGDQCDLLGLANEVFHFDSFSHRVMIEAGASIVSADCQLKLPEWVQHATYH